MPEIVERISATEYVRRMLSISEQKISEARRRKMSRRRSEVIYAKQQTKRITEDLLGFLRLIGWDAVSELAVKKLGCIERRRIDVYAKQPAFGIDSAFEVKVCREDYMAERRNPAKYAPAKRACGQFWYVCPVTVLCPSDIPTWAGLMTWNAGEFVIAKSAPFRDPSISETEPQLSNPVGNEVSER